MNIFILSLIIEKCAIYHCNAHVIKMVLESCQLLCSCHRILDPEPISEELYKKSHVNHPCAIWVRESSENYDWLYELFVALANEYTHRYGKVHLSYRKLAHILKERPKNIKIGPKTRFALAMPEYIKNEFKDSTEDADIVRAYRNYYRLEKDFCKWTKRDIPEWFNKTF